MPVRLFCDYSAYIMIIDECLKLLLHPQYVEIELHDTISYVCEINIDLVSSSILLLHSSHNTQVRGHRNSIKLKADLGNSRYKFN